tara:strand:- start:202 stop:729 length:528 start_codon:yes stop_codon:yes gene_type:complete
MSILLPNLTDKEFSAYNDVKKMRRIIGDFFDRVILTKKATNRNVNSGELKHLIEHWAETKRDERRNHFYQGNTYILEPFLVKVMYEKGIALREQNVSTTNILYSRCFVGIAKKSIQKIQCFNNQSTPDDNFKVKPFFWHRRGPLYKHHIKRLEQLGYDNIGKRIHWENIYFGKHV